MDDIEKKARELLAAAYTGRGLYTDARELLGVFVHEFPPQDAYEAAALDALVHVLRAAPAAAGVPDGLDEAINGAVSNLEMMGLGRDTVSGDDLTRHDIMRIANDTMRLLLDAWNAAPEQRAVPTNEMIDAGVVAAGMGTSYRYPREVVAAIYKAMTDVPAEQQGAGEIPVDEALTYLEIYFQRCGDEGDRKYVQVIRDALAARQPVGQEPVGIVIEEGPGRHCAVSRRARLATDLPVGTMLYAATVAERPPVDLEQFREAVIAYGATGRNQRCEPIVNEAGRLLALIDSQKERSNG